MRAETTDTRHLDHVERGGRYCYKVTSVYNDLGIICESAATDSASITMFTGIGEPGLTKVFIYPNPAREYLMVVSEEEMISVNLYNSIGSQVLGMEVAANNCRIDLNGLSPGIYLIDIMMEIGNHRQRLIRY